MMNDDFVQSLVALTWLRSQGQQKEKLVWFIFLHCCEQIRRKFGMVLNNLHLSILVSF